MVWQTKFEFALSFFGFCRFGEWDAGFVCFERESGGQTAGGDVFFRCLVANCIRRFAVVQAGPGKR